MQNTTQNNADLVLVDKNRSLCYAWEEQFKGLYNIYIVNDLLEELDNYDNVPNWDGLVAAGNSFGIMDGGADLAIRNYFGNKIEREVQKHIVIKYHGELLVGQAEVVPTNDEKHPYVVYTPTMRFPLDIRYTDNVYKAMWASLLATESSGITVLACTGLGTGAGRMPYEESARQMALAYKNFMNPPIFIDWEYADQRSEEIYYT